MALDGSLLLRSTSGRSGLCMRSTATACSGLPHALLACNLSLPRSSPHSPARLVCRCLPAARAACSRSLSARMAMARCCRMPKWSASSSAVQLRQQGREGRGQGGCKGPGYMHMHVQTACPHLPLSGAAAPTPRFNRTTATEHRLFSLPLAVQAPHTSPPWPHTHAAFLQP